MRAKKRHTARKFSFWKYTFCSIMLKFWFFFSFFNRILFIWCDTLNSKGRLCSTPDTFWQLKKKQINKEVNTHEQIKNNNFSGSKFWHSHVTHVENDAWQREIKEQRSPFLDSPIFALLLHSLFLLGFFFSCSAPKKKKTNQNVPSDLRKWKKKNPCLLMKL